MKVLAIACALICANSLMITSLEGVSGSASAADDPAQLRPVMQAPEPKKAGMEESPLSSYPVLKAAAEVGTLPALATPIKACPLTQFRGKKLSFVALNVKNLSDQVAIIDGDSSQAEVDAGLIGTASASTLIQGASQNLTPKGKLLVGAATVASLGLAGMIVLENMTPDQHKK